MFTGKVAMHFTDYLIFMAYSLLLWQTLQSWWRLRAINDRRKESLLTALLLVMMVSILTFVGANAYMLEHKGETLLSMRLFQIFVMANFFVYWFILTLLRKEIMDGDTA